ARLGHARDGGLGFLTIDPAGLKLPRQFPARMLAADQQAHRALRRRRLGPASTLLGSPTLACASAGSSDAPARAEAACPAHAQALAARPPRLPVLSPSASSPLSSASSASASAMTTGAIF